MPRGDRMTPCLDCGVQLLQEPEIVDTFVFDGRQPLCRGCYVARDQRQKVGFTGTRERLPQPQIAALFYLMKDSFPFELHHGDCVGADAEANAIFSSLRLGTTERIILHPQTNERHRAFCRTEPQDEVRDPKLPLDRNQEIVDETERLIACPRYFTEELQSGTWSTIRRALKAEKNVTVIWPDGSVTPDYRSEKSKLHLNDPATRAAYEKRLAEWDERLRSLTDANRRAERITGGDLNIIVGPCSEG